MIVLHELAGGFVTEVRDGEGATLLQAGAPAQDADRGPHPHDLESAADIRRFLDGFDEALSAMERGPRTLTHNDFNTRNICLRPEGPGPRLAVYDWELPCVQNPQRDLIEFLVYALPAGASMDLFNDYAAFYRECLERVSGWRR